MCMTDSAVDGSTEGSMSQGRTLIIPSVGEEGEVPTPWG